MASVLQKRKKQTIIIEQSPIDIPSEFDVEVSERSISVIDASPIGFFGLAVGAAILAASYLESSTTPRVYAVSWFMFLSGLAQISSGILSIFRRAVFKPTLFIATGAFFLAVGWLYYKKDLAVTTTEETEHLGGLAGAFALFTIALFLVSLYVNKALPVLLLGLIVGFASLFAKAYFDAPKIIIAAGFSLASAGSFYHTFASWTNSFSGKPALPLGSAPFSKDRVQERN